ncbi:alcohol dehydrogenase catalytic domain-containing protein [Microbispora rosea]|uniref:alcohol dehydrogenase catalytic domain-containing protein n=1 Tax=Microbispora rosea TaxID=58117 RepID=UPI00342992CE
MSAALRACVCGSDLWPYRSRAATQHGDRIGHEFLGLVDEIGSEVHGLKRGDVVVAPAVWSAGSALRSTRRCRWGPGSS